MSTLAAWGSPPPTPWPSTCPASTAQVVPACANERQAHTGRGTAQSLVHPGTGQSVVAPKHKCLSCFPRVICLCGQPSSGSLAGSLPSQHTQRAIMGQVSSRHGAGYAGAQSRQPFHCQAASVTSEEPCSDAPVS